MFVNKPAKTNTDEILESEILDTFVISGVPGHEIAGIVTMVGKKVTKFKICDKAGVGCMVVSCGVYEDRNEIIKPILFFLDGLKI